MPARAYDHFTSHDGLAIAYRVSGHGKPVILIHGYTVTSAVNFATHYVSTDGGVLESTPGPTVESALLDAGFRVVMYDLRGHGRSAKPRDPACYDMGAHVGDVEALAQHLSLDRPAVVGYSLGSNIAGRLVSSSWVSAVALCGTGSYVVEGEYPEVDEERADVAKCFSEGCWNDYPDLGIFRTWAELDEDPDFLALAAVARGVQGVPAEILRAANMPVLVLNGGADGGATDEFDLTPYVPGARRAVVGDSDHGVAPSDPLFHDELARFLQTAIQESFIGLPEPKSVKNRVHLDAPVAADQLDSEVQRLCAAGATLIGYNEYPGHRAALMQDPEGNEFDLH